jgi:CheY-like chemotaxis protein
MLADTSNEPVKILLADDDADDRFFFQKALNELKFPTELITVNDGADLMNLLLKDPDRLPDVLFLDINMPRKNGTECLLEIKQHAKLKGLPVIIYSTSLRDDIADSHYLAGAHYYLKKPDFTEISNAIEKVLKLLVENTAQPPRDQFII